MTLSIPPKTIETEQERGWRLDWMVWPGGHRPHEPSTEVEIERRDGRIERGCSAFTHWWHDGSPDDIVAYRLVPPVEPVKPAKTYVTHDDFDFSDMPMDGAYNPFGGPL